MTKSAQHTELTTIYVGWIEFGELYSLFHPILVFFWQWLMDHQSSPEEYQNPVHMEQTV